MAPKREISIKDIKVDDSFWNGRIGNAVEKAGHNFIGCGYVYYVG